MALGLTGSFGFQHSSLEGAPFVVAVVIGLGAPVAAILFAIRESIYGVIEVFRPPRDKTE